MPPEEEIPSVTMFMGQNVDDMTCEQAIAALKVCARILTETNDRVLMTHAMYRKILGARGSRG